MSRVPAESGWRKRFPSCNEQPEESGYGAPEGEAHDGANYHVPEIMLAREDAAEADQCGPDEYEPLVRSVPVVSVCLKCYAGSRRKAESVGGMAGKESVISGSFLEDMEPVPHHV